MIGQHCENHDVDQSLSVKYVMYPYFYSMELLEKNCWSQVLPSFPEILVQKCLSRVKTRKKINDMTMRNSPAK